jgi:hypothetical protein
LPYDFRRRKATPRLAKQYDGRINAAMTRSGKSHDNAKKPASREARLAAALRENLRRRKAQERGRGAPAEGDTGGEPGKPPDSRRIR